MRYEVKCLKINKALKRRVHCSRLKQPNYDLSLVEVKLVIEGRLSAYDVSVFNNNDNNLSVIMQEHLTAIYTGKSSLTKGPRYEPQ